MADTNDDIKMVEKIVEEVFPDLVVGMVAELRNKPYGIIKCREKIKYGNKIGDLVWDYLIFNEITFEDDDTHQKVSFGVKWNDKETEMRFNELVKKYGI